MKWLFLSVSVVAPLVFRLAYQPINATWTVHTFGCGCPPLDDSSRFNANHFNAIVWLIVLTTCMLPWMNVYLRREMTLALAFSGILAVAYLCLSGFGSGIWL